MRTETNFTRLITEFKRDKLINDSALAKEFHKVPILIEFENLADESRNDGCGVSYIV